MATTLNPSEISDLIKTRIETVKLSNTCVSRVARRCPAMSR
ncbi:hypothetical protein QUF31_21235 [Dickeya chrysanthemi]|nr:hypothetical protein [Dickeya chrysanthemi]WJM85492.1 hypothetical protein QUF31_21235 [Dickeya chrysanthemi]